MSAVNCRFILSSIFNCRVRLHLPSSSVFFTEQEDCMTRRFSTSTGSGSSDLDSSSTSGVLALGLGGGVGSLKAVSGKMPFLQNIRYKQLFQKLCPPPFKNSCLFHSFFSKYTSKSDFMKSLFLFQLNFIQYFQKKPNNSLIFTMYLTSSSNFSLSRGGDDETLRTV